MSENPVSLGRLFVQEAVRAGTWGLIFLIVVGILSISIRKDVKKAIAYGIDHAIESTMIYATNPVLIGKTKQLIKEGIEYTLSNASKEAKSVLSETRKK